MSYNNKKWPFKWYGLWKEYGVGYENYPSIFNFVDKNINERYDKDKLLEYLSNGSTVTSTSAINFPSPFHNDNNEGTVSFRTDGEWVWLDNIVKYIKYNNLLIPDIWLKKLIDKNYILDIKEIKLDKLDWPTL